MIVLNLLTLSPDRAKRVTHLMLTEHLATDVFVDEAIANHYLTPEGTVAEEPLYRVIFITKALLYRRIEELLEQHFPANDFRVYATLVTQVNETEAERIRQLHKA
ncbi:hypothetical protein [Hymenobacter psychrophilus]|uniref:Uncharacterized protein n=1 Tax=Hymenobacter psychrophilus TaxID=651662 RepID=A0A1H3BN89_9BACT|nr:hypothetical protein [Hymenobacter psychrophilus]SDX43158.1 hypothetical protein SAMN04488069_101352 [Hymenobacter psychrophilus]